MNQPVQTVPIPLQPVQMQAPAAVQVESSAKMKYLALIWGLLIVAMATVAIYFLSSARSTMDNISNAFSPKIKYTVLLSGAIGKLNNDPKLVVLTSDITATVTTENTTTFMDIPVGFAKAEVSAPARIQHYLPVKDMSADDFYYDELGKRLVVKIPRPVLDREMVDIDREKVTRHTELGWSPFSVFKGPGARAEAERLLKEAALKQGEHELLTDRAEKNAKVIMTKQLEPVVEALKADKLRLDVEFRKQ